MALSESEELELLNLEKEHAQSQGQGGQGLSKEDAFKALANMSLGPLAKTGMAQAFIDPANAQKKYGVALPIVGGMVGGPIGAAVGQTANIAAGTALGNPETPSTPAGIAGSVIGQGVAQEPKILNAIPGVPKVAQMAGDLASKVGSKVGGGLAKMGQALTGAKAQDLEQAAKQGYSTYIAPSMEKAQQIFGGAMEKAGIPSKPPLENVIDPQLTTARDTALHVGKLLENGVELSPQEALLGRQAIDRIYSATPVIDRSTRGHLADLRTAFDDALAGKAGALKDASTLYRQAIVKSNLLNPFRITKQGQMSAVAPMIATLAASGGAVSGRNKEAGLGGLGYLAASSPALAGLAATTGGSAAQAFGALASNPVARQALMQVFQRLVSRSKSSAPAQ